ncbi:nucleoside deaminase [Williamsoniiplasma lucivorax]|uniref:tRNA-specific adenosine deaminase n=1 Tax=Williamsoniiplasma lucivorax TaxID=209274 RepID=A0A2S5REY1_9MOLU|nr:nucleoside deaminase [Williamsoniiplasma lucivorax]PPE05886.1 tRNA-specific adenosine deaminase [Williamsoniiplasma lucivorax]
MTDQQFSFLMQVIEKTKKHNDVPVSAIIVDQQNNIVSFGVNKCERKSEITAHAEIVAINKLSKKIKSLNLNEYKIISTLEPCVMCYGAIKQAKIQNVEYILDGTKYGVLKNLCINDIKFTLRKVGTKDQTKNCQEKIESFFKKLR